MNNPKQQSSKSQLYKIINSDNKEIFNISIQNEYNITINLNCECLKRTYFVNKFMICDICNMKDSYYICYSCQIKVCFDCKSDLISNSENTILHKEMTILNEKNEFETDLLRRKKNIKEILLYTNLITNNEMRNNIEERKTEKEKEKENDINEALTHSLYHIEYRRIHSYYYILYKKVYLNIEKINILLKINMKNIEKFKKFRNIFEITTNNNLNSMLNSLEYNKTNQENKINKLNILCDNINNEINSIDIISKDIYSDINLSSIIKSYINSIQSGDDNEKKIEFDMRRYEYEFIYNKNSFVIYNNRSYMKCYSSLRLTLLGKILHKNKEVYVELIDISSLFYNQSSEDNFMKVIVNIDNNGNYSIVKVNIEENSQFFIRLYIEYELYKFKHKIEENINLNSEYHISIPSESDKYLTYLAYKLKKIIFYEIFDFDQINSNSLSNQKTKSKFLITVNSLSFIYSVEIYQMKSIINNKQSIIFQKIKLFTSSIELVMFIPNFIIFSFKTSFEIRKFPSLSVLFKQNTLGCVFKIINDNDNSFIYLCDSYCLYKISYKNNSFSITFIDSILNKDKVIIDFVDIDEFIVILTSNSEVRLYLKETMSYIQSPNLILSGSSCIKKIFKIDIDGVSYLNLAYSNFIIRQYSIKDIRNM